MYASMNSEMRLASSAVRGVMAGNIALSSGRSDQAAHAGELGEMVVGVTEQRVDDADAFEIVPDLVLHGHADATSSWIACWPTKRPERPICTLVAAIALRRSTTSASSAIIVASRHMLRACSSAISMSAAR